MYVQRRDGAIVGVFRAIQTGIAEELLADSDPQVLAFLAGVPGVRALQDVLESWDCKLDATIMSLIDQTRTQWRAWAATNFPTLTAAEKTRLGDLFWVVAVGVREQVR